MPQAHLNQTLYLLHSEGCNASGHMIICDQPASVGKFGEQDKFG